MTKMPQLRSAIDGVHDNMKDVKSSIKNAAKLRDLSAHRPILSNETRWTGKHDVLLQHTHLNDSMEEAFEDPVVNFRMSRSTNFSNEVVKHQKIIYLIKLPTKEM